MTTDALTTTEVADKVGTDARKLRKFLRDFDAIESPGRGGRYDFSDAELEELKAAYEEWAAIHTRGAKAEEAEEIDLESLTYDELYALAQDRDIAGRSKLTTKAKLIDALS